MRAQYSPKRCHPISPRRIEATEQRRGDPDIPLHHSTSFILVIFVLWSMRRSFTFNHFHSEARGWSGLLQRAGRGSRSTLQFQPGSQTVAAAKKSYNTVFFWGILMATNVSESVELGNMEKKNNTINRRSSSNINIYHSISLGMQAPTLNCLFDLHHII